MEGEERFIVGSCVKNAGGNGGLKGSRFGRMGYSAFRKIASFGVCELSLLQRPFKTPQGRLAQGH